MRSLLLLVLLALGCRGGRLGGTAGELRADPRALQLPGAFVGYPRSLSLTLSNTSAAAVTARLELAAPFQVEPGALEVPGGGARTVEVRFAPTSAGPASAALSIRWLDQLLVVPVAGVASEPPSCPAADECQLLRFDPERGDCVSEPLADGTACADGNACLASARCSRGACVGVEKSCDDQNLCTRDSCSPSVGCLHEDISASCDSPAERCRAPGEDLPPCSDAERCLVGVCHPKTGCGVAPAADGDPCGSSDCVSSQVCIAAACVTRPTPDGAACAAPTLCRAAGACRAQQCELPPATALRPAWSYQPSIGRELHYQGQIDPEGNSYLFESTPEGTSVELLSFGAAGVLRYRLPVAACRYSGCYGLDWVLEPAGRKLYVVNGGAQVQARHLHDGQLIWQQDATAGLPVHDPGSGGAGVFRTHTPMLPGTGSLLVVTVIEGAGNHWSYLVALDRTAGAVQWRASKKGHTYGSGATSAGGVWLSSADCWAPAGELALFDASGQQQGSRGFTGSLAASDEQLAWIPGYGATAANLVPKSFASFSVAAPTGAASFGAEALLSGQRLLLVVTSGGAALRSELMELSTATRQPQWSSLLGYGDGADLVLLSSGSVFATLGKELVTIGPLGQQSLRCPLPDYPASPAAVRGGRYTTLMGGALRTFLVPGLDTAASGWVSKRGSPERDRRAH